MPSIYGAQIVGGLIFGVGFVMGAWCPGTAAVGLASGRLDALVFLAGAGIGSVFFNEMFGIIKNVYTWGDGGVRFAWQAWNMSAPGFAFLFVLAGVGCFWGAEYLERRVKGTATYWRTPFLRSFSAALVILALGLMALEGRGAGERSASLSASTSAMLADIESAKDHMEPEELADRLMRGRQASRWSIFAQRKSTKSSTSAGLSTYPCPICLPPWPEKRAKDHRPLLQRHDTSGSGARRALQDGLHERLHPHRRPCRIYRHAS